MFTESDGEGNGMYEGINLKDAKEEQAEMLKHFSKEIPEQADIRSKIRNC
jgi:hypothetical protein